MNDPKISGIAALNLKDPSLFRQQCYIDGKWADADSGKSIPVNNPATGEILGTVPTWARQRTRRAIEAANAAFPAWRVKTAKERANILRKWFDLMMANQEDLARILTAEQGKPLAEARTEISYGASFIEWFAEEAKRIYGDTIPGHQADKRIVVIKEPIGVCAAITPWNFPNAMITRKSGPALAAGCTMVLKPATMTPYSALAMAELGERAGIPKGVFSVLTGSSAAIGGEITSNPIVRKVTFTGSTAVGKILLEQCSKTVKKTSMELGGNAPFIVFDDADLDAAVEGALASKYRNTGQTCVCANRLLVQDKVYDALRLQTHRKSKGDESRQRHGTRRRAGTAHRQGRGGKSRRTHRGRALERRESPDRRQAPRPRRHLLRAHRPSQRQHHHESNERETFGPVAPLFRFKDEKEAIKLANDTEFGLASYFYGRDLKPHVARRRSPRIRHRRHQYRNHLH